MTLDRCAHGVALTGFEVTLDLGDRGQCSQRVGRDSGRQLVVEQMSCVRDVGHHVKIPLRPPIVKNS
jgi:hypothetical protein